MMNLEPTEFSVAPYVPFHCLTGGHSDTVNTLAFSPDGAYLASGGDDNALIIWKISDGSLLFRSLHKSAVDVVIWHPVHTETVIVGCEGGWLFQMHDFSLRGVMEHEIHIGVRSTVHCLDYDATTRYLAIGLGDEVHITFEASKHVYRGDVKLPSPSDREDIDESQERRLRAIAVRFHKNGKQLIVGYLAHGIVCWDIGNRAQLWAIQMPSATAAIGGVAFSPDNHDIAVYNLLNGLDCYAAGSNRGSRLVYKLDRAPRSNHHVKVCYIHCGSAVVCGTTTGNVCVWKAVSGEVFQLLAHDDDIIQAVSAAMTSKSSYIAAGSAAKGQSTYIKVWRAGITTRKDLPPDISDVVVDVVRAVTSNHLYQPKDGIRQGITIAFTIVVCFTWFWALTLVPWSSVWGNLVSTGRSSVEVAMAIGGFLWTFGVLVWGYTSTLYSATAERAFIAWTVAKEWIMDALRSALREFLFPTLAMYQALDPVQQGHDIPVYAGEL